MVYIPGKTGNSDILLHYGVLGMKWGVRRARQTQPTQKRTRKKRSDQIKKSNYLYWKKLADDTNHNRQLAKIDAKTHKRLHKDIRKIIDKEAVELNGKGIDKKSGDLFVRSQLSQAYKTISQFGYNIKSYEDLKRTVLEDTDINQSDLIATAYSYNPYVHSKKEGRAYESKVFNDKYGKIHKKYDPDIQDVVKRIVDVNAKDIAVRGYKNAHDSLMETYIKEDFSRYMSKDPSLSGGKVSTKKERKRLGISKENEEKTIRKIAREEATQNNNFLSYYDVKASLKNDYRELIELENDD